jgi:hypothetical protein
VQLEDRLHPDQLRHPAGDTERTWSGGACVFASRCAFAHDACHEQPALLTVPGSGTDPTRRTAACHVADAWRTQLDSRLDLQKEAVS